MEPQRRRILDAAVTVFGRYGFRQASVGLVAEEAGLSRQALYRWFGAKETLFEAVVEDLHAEAIRAGDVATQAARATGLDAAGVLAAQVSARLDALMGRLRHSPHAAELVEENGQRCGAIALEAGRRFAARLAATATEEAAAGRLAFPPGLDAATLARFLIAAARGLKAAVPPPEPDALARDLDRMTRLVVAGAASAASPPSPVT
jgi:AcrR family transcriptional regulator